jgi:hypothetical protein
MAFEAFSGYRLAPTLFNPHRAVIGGWHHCYARFAVLWRLFCHVRMVSAAYCTSYGYSHLIMLFAPRLHFKVCRERHVPGCIHGLDRQWRFGWCHLVVNGLPSGCCQDTSTNTGFYQAAIQRDSGLHATARSGTWTTSLYQGTQCLSSTRVSIERCDVRCV